KLEMRPLSCYQAAIFDSGDCSDANLFFVPHLLKVQISSGTACAIAGDFRLAAVSIEDAGSKDGIAILRRSNKDDAISARPIIALTQTYSQFAGRIYLVDVCDLND